MNKKRYSHKFLRPVRTCMHLKRMLQRSTNVRFALLAAALALPLMAKDIYDFTMKTIDGKQESLDAYKGKVVLIVNVASKCGFTPQYSGLESLYEKYKDQGFVILGFPANNFASQEPGTDAEIKKFCSTKYNVSFPMFSKISVTGADTAPLYQYLTEDSANPSVHGAIQWNFTKFLIGRDGRILARFEPKVTPESSEVTNAIETALH